METSNINYLETAKNLAKNYHTKILKEKHEAEEINKKNKQRLYDFGVQLFNTLNPFDNLPLLDKKCLQIHMDESSKIHIKAWTTGGVFENLYDLYITVEQKISCKAWYKTKVETLSFENIDSFMAKFIEDIHPRILIIS